MSRVDIRVHPYAPDPRTDYPGPRPCTCGLPEQWRGHQLPDTTEADAASKRRAGERTEP